MSVSASFDLLLRGGRVICPASTDGSSRPLCCGRTFLSAGLVDEARAEVARSLAALAPYAARGAPVIGLEPSCLLGLRDELKALLPGADTRPVIEALCEEINADAVRLARESGARFVLADVGPTRPARQPHPSRQ